MRFLNEIDISIVPKTIVDGKFPITDTVISACVATAAIVLLALAVRLFFIPRWRREYCKKSGFRILIEYLVGMFDDGAREQVGHNGRPLGVFYFSCAALIFFSTMIEMFGLRPATSDLSLTLTFGLSTFLIIIVMGFKEKGVKRIKHYLVPLFDLTDAVVPLSIALRTFGSVFSGYLIMHLLYDLPVWAQFGIPVLGNVMFTIFHAIIQSYVFMFLSLSLINEATE
ncbi:MAG: F0F1 ATP synthase subunit A [Clostridiales bacterium]|jgi:F-type H+-transporting ATPase subunit a|nr:F0F1 ATP synthase subunit A [Clostridiales bacterium]